MKKTQVYLQIRAILTGPKRGVLKAQRLAYLKRRYPDGKITANFSCREFFCRDGMPFPIRACSHLEWYCKNILEPMRQNFGVCYVTGPYRHYWYNRLVVKGVLDSRHDWDKHPDEIAIDLAFARGNPVEWAEFAARRLEALSRGGGIGVYMQDRAYFTHVDTRRRRGRWFGSQTSARRVAW